MALRPEQNPDQLFPEDILKEISNDITWWVAHTKSRSEKALAHFLSKKNIGYYLPLIKTIQPSRNRVRFSMLPLFPGYLFFRGGLDERYQALTSNKIAGIIKVTNPAKLVNELLGIHKVLESGAKVYPYDYLAEGQRVRITSGPMRGVEGIINRKKSNYHLILRVETIAQAIALDLKADMVEAA